MHPVCLHTIFLHYILPCPTILLRINWWIQLKELSKEKALFILPVMIGMPSSHLLQSEIIIYGLVSKYVKLSPFSQTIFILDLALNYNWPSAFGVI